MKVGKALHQATRAVSTTWSQSGETGQRCCAGLTVSSCVATLCPTDSSLLGLLTGGMGHGQSLLGWNHAPWVTGVG